MFILFINGKILNIKYMQQLEVVASHETDRHVKITMANGKVYREWLTPGELSHVYELARKINTQTNDDKETNKAE